MTYEEIKEISVEADRLGFDSIWISDHMMHPFKVEGFPRYYCHEALTTMSAIGALTNQIKLGFSTLVPVFRRPAVMAKMVTSLDILSNGRLILCLGSGWMEIEHLAYDMTWIKDHDERIENEREAILIMKKLFTEPITNYTGKYNQIKDAIMEPKPIQKPHPPIWIGGNSPKSKEVIIELADGWLLFDMGKGIEKIRKRINVMKEKVADRPFDVAIDLEVPLDKEEFIIERIKEYVDIGASLINMQFRSVKELQQFAQNIMSVFT